MEEYQKEIIKETTTTEEAAQAGNINQTWDGVETVDTLNVFIEGAETGFWNDGNKKVAAGVGAGLATLAAGFTGGFYTGKHVEKKKREMFKEEILNTITIIKAQANGEETVDINGIKVPTSTHKVDNTKDLEDIITNQFLKDNKMKLKEKMEWISITMELTSLGQYARAKQFETSNEIVRDKEETEK